MVVSCPVSQARSESAVGSHDPTVKITGTGLPVRLRLASRVSANREVSVVFPAPARPSITNRPDGIRSKVSTM